MTKNQRHDGKTKSDDQERYLYLALKIIERAKFDAHGGDYSARLLQSKTPHAAAEARQWLDTTGKSWLDVLGRDG